VAQLITMRQRIRAVETIKKITHAMRLISMSTHSRLRHQKVNLENYKNAFQLLWSHVQHLIVCPSEVVAPPVQNNLIILVASQKGLCGTFNSSLFKFFDAQLQPSEYNHFVAIGKKATDYFVEHDKPTLASYNNLNAAHFVSIAQAVTAIITNSSVPYESVTVYSNYQKSFFVQKPHKSVIFPIAECSQSESEAPTEYLFEQSPEELYLMIRHLMLTVTLQEILYDSLLAEHAARFLSMDSSTRNAENLLISMKLEYNKTRQTAITRELTELATSY
jgi:F-type H+-transporting ATPase subunit gamma